MNGFWNDQPRIRSELAEVTALIESTVRVEGFPVSDAIIELVRANGKMLRPALILVCAGFGTPDPARLHPLAAAVEILHTATLIHDDLIDGARLRRGVRTLHARFNALEAVLAGDFLLSRCFRLAAESTTPANAKALAALVEAVCLAEIGQDMRRHSYSASPRLYFRTIAGKTAALFSLACHAGAVESGCKPDVAQRLRRAGYDIGMAFQVIDDILDFEGAEGVMGKPVGRDVAEGLCTLPLVYALSERGDELRSLLAERPLAEPTVAKVVAIVRASSGLSRARESAGLHTARALREIGMLPDKPARIELWSIAERLLVRDY
ncbi:MAG: polyprenyl synthetase family protein [Spirochaetes bacterium]|nr:polyprenyl synthetase family protein [Spirochaetota bacterium]